MNPNWSKVNQLAFYNSSRRFELRTTENKLSASDVGGTLTRSLRITETSSALSARPR